MFVSKTVVTDYQRAEAKIHQMNISEASILDFQVELTPFDDSNEGTFSLLYKNEICLADRNFELIQETRINVDDYLSPKPNQMGNGEHFESSKAYVWEETRSDSATQGMHSLVDACEGDYGLESLPLMSDDETQSFAEPVVPVLRKRVVKRNKKITQRLNQIREARQDEPKRHSKGNGIRGRAPTNYYEFMEDSKQIIELLDAEIKELIGDKNRLEQKELSEETRNEIRALRNQRQAQNTRMKQRKHNENQKVLLSKIIGIILPDKQSCHDNLCDLFFNVDKDSDKTYTDFLK